MVDYKCKMIERKDRVRKIMSEIENHKMMEVSAGIGEAESSLTPGFAKKATVNTDMCMEILESYYVMMDV